jgi:hypothetical protein
MGSVRQQINSCLARYRKTDWPTTIDAIDYLIEAFPENNRKNQVIAKLVCVDRIYGGSLYRLGLRSYTKELNKIAEALIYNSSKIDNLFSNLNAKRKYNPKLRDKCIKTFDDTMELLYPKDRSVLLSKYFHFHAPNFFPILDRFASVRLRKVLNDLKIDIEIPRGSSRYYQFYIGIEALYKYFKGDYSFRDLDIFLYGDRWLLD